MGSVRSFPTRPESDVPDTLSVGGADRRLSSPTPAAAGGLVTVLLLVLVLPCVARAQVSPLLVELRGGAALPSGGFLDEESGWDGMGGGAPSFGADFTLVWSGRWGSYFGFGQDRFECPSDRCAREDELVATGFDLGLRVLLFSDSRVVPWIGGGGLSYRVERHRTGAPSTATGRGWGWEVGAGSYLVLSERVYLNPSARLRSLDLDRGEPNELRVRAVVVDLGLVLAF